MSNNISVHQIWLSFNNGRTPSNIHEMCINAWKSMYPSYKLWQNEDALSLIRNSYPMFLPLFEDTTLKYPIIKCDVLRLIILYHLGGIYADIDIYPLRPISFHEETSFEIILTDEWYKSSQLTESVHNAIMIARKKKNTFWLSLALDILQKYKSGELPQTESEVFDFSGPKFINTMVRKHLFHYENKLTVLPYYYFCPFDIIDDNEKEHIMSNNESKVVPGRWVYPCINTNNMESALKRYPQSFTLFIHQNSLWK